MRRNREMVRRLSLVALTVVSIGWCQAPGAGSTDLEGELTLLQRDYGDSQSIIVLFKPTFAERHFPVVLRLIGQNQSERVWTLETKPKGPHHIDLDPSFLANEKPVDIQVDAQNAVSVKKPFSLEKEVKVNINRSPKGNSAILTFICADPIKITGLTSTFLTPVPNLPVQCGQTTPIEISGKRGSSPPKDDEVEVLMEYTVSEQGQRHKETFHIQKSYFWTSKGLREKIEDEPLWLLAVVAIPLFSVLLAILFRWNPLRPKKDDRRRHAPPIESQKALDPIEDPEKLISSKLRDLITDFRQEITKIEPLPTPLKTLPETMQKIYGELKCEVGELSVHLANISDQLPVLKASVERSLAKPVLKDMVYCKEGSSDLSKLYSNMVRFEDAWEKLKRSASNVHHLDRHLAFQIDRIVDPFFGCFDLIGFGILSRAVESLQREGMTVSRELALSVGDLQLSGAEWDLRLKDQIYRMCIRGRWDYVARGLLRLFGLRNILQVPQDAEPALKEFLERLHASKERAHDAMRDLDIYPLGGLKVGEPINVNTDRKFIVYQENPHPAEWYFSPNSSALEAAKNDRILLDVRKWCYLHQNRISSWDDEKAEVITSR